MLEAIQRPFAVYFTKFCVEQLYTNMILMTFVEFALNHAPRHPAIIWHVVKLNLSETRYWNSSAETTACFDSSVAVCQSYLHA